MSTTRRIVALAPTASHRAGRRARGGGDTDSLLGKVEAARQDRHVDRPAVPAAVRRSRTDGTYEGFDIDVGTEIAKRLGVDDRVRDPELGHHHRRLVERALGLQRRLDDDHDPAREDPRLQQALLLHAGPDGRQHRLGDHHPRRPGRQDDLRRRGDDVLRLAERHARPRLVHRPSGAAARRREGRRRSTPTASAPRRSKAGREDFEGWLSSSTTVDAGDRRRAAARQGRRPGLLRAARASPSTRAVPTRRRMVEKVNEILDEMRADGTLKALLREVVRRSTSPSSRELTADDRLIPTGASARTPPSRSRTGGGRR